MISIKRVNNKGLAKSCIFTLVIISIFTILISNVSALGVTPGRTIINYEPNTKKTVEFTIINTEHKNMKINVYAKGDLNESIKLSEQSFEMKADEDEKNLKYEINMPELTPGLHQTEIVVLQLPDSVNANRAAYIGAALAVVTQFSIYAPYPGKYIEGELKVSGNESKKTFILDLTSRGQENIDKVEANIDVFDINGSKVKELKTNSISLISGERKEITADWDVNAPQGKYNVKAVVDYDNSKLPLEKDFEVGEILLDLLQIYVKDFSLGDIAKFDMVVKNKWNEPITNAYAEMRAFDSSLNELADLKSPTYDIPPGLQTIMTYYWDTKGIKQGLYNANVILYYSGKKTQQDIKLDVGQNKIDITGIGYVISEGNNASGSTVQILAVIIGFLILLNIFWFLILRKKMHKKSKKF